MNEDIQLAQTPVKTLHGGRKVVKYSFSGAAMCRSTGILEYPDVRVY